MFICLRQSYRIRLLCDFDNSPIFSEDITIFTNFEPPFAVHFV